MLHSAPVSQYGQCLADSPAEMATKPSTMTLKALTLLHARRPKLPFPQLALRSNNRVLHREAIRHFEALHLTMLYQLLCQSSLFTSYLRRTKSFSYTSNVSASWQHGLSGPGRFILVFGDTVLCNVEEFEAGWPYAGTSLDVGANYS